MSTYWSSHFFSRQNLSPDWRPSSIPCDLRSPIGVHLIYAKTWQPRSGNCLRFQGLSPYWGLSRTVCFYVKDFRKQRTYSAQVWLHCVLLMKIISVKWIKSNWFDFIHYTQIIFLSKNLIFLTIYILKIFFTMLHLKIFLEYWIILCIFRIL